MMRNTDIHRYNVLRAQERLLNAQKELVEALKLQATYRNRALFGPLAHTVKTLKRVTR